MPTICSSATTFALGGFLLCSACDSGPDTGHASEAACTIEVDGTHQERADGIANRLTRRHFDTAGRIAREEMDTNGDGGMDQFSVHHYDAVGRRYRREIFQTGSEALLSFEDWSFDGDGREVLHTRASDAARGVDETVVTLYHGEETVVRTTRSGSLQSVEEVRHGPHGVLEWVGDGAFGLARRVYHYDERGLQVRVEEFRDGELVGIADTRYDDAGRKTTTLSTRDGVETLTTYSHDERGFINGWVRDEGRDGRIDASAVCLFDDQGRMIAEDVDTDNDGVVDSIFATSFDAQGRVLYQLDDWDGERGAGETIIAYQYDCRL